MDCEVKENPTFEPRFLNDRIKYAGDEVGNVFLLGLARCVPNINVFYEKFDRGEISYLATGGGDNLTTEVYGDAIVPLSFIMSHWSKYFNVFSSQNFPDKIWHQARLVVHRNLNSGSYSFHVSVLPR